MLMKRALSELNEAAARRAFDKLESKVYAREYEFDIPSMLKQYICTEEGHLTVVKKSIHML